MPIYEYRCGRCEETLEVIQKLSDLPLRKCPHCSGRLHKLISRTSFQLKGGGWFVNDYGAAPPPKDRKEGKPDPKPAKAGPSADTSAAKKTSE